MKYLFIELAIQDGEREHTHRVLHTTEEKNINFAAQKYAAQFWGESYVEDGKWWAWGGEIAISIERVRELTEQEYQFLSGVLYGGYIKPQKTLYYTIEPSFYDDGSLNGIRKITVYTIENNHPKTWFELECMSEAQGEYFKTNEEEIQDWLDDNGYGDKEVNMIQL